MRELRFKEIVKDVVDEFGNSKVDAFVEAHDNGGWDGERVTDIIVGKGGIWFFAEVSRPFLLENGKVAVGIRLQSDEKDKDGKKIDSLFTTVNVEDFDPSKWDGGKNEVLDTTIKTLIDCFDEDGRCPYVDPIGLADELIRVRDKMSTMVKTTANKLTEILNLAEGFDVLETDYANAKIYSDMCDQIEDLRDESHDIYYSEFLD